MTTDPLQVWLDRDGGLLRLRLSRPKANIIDAEMISALGAALEEHSGNTRIAAVLLDAEGPHFSFGASVAEHLPDQCADMLRALHGLVLQMLAYAAPILVAVRGQCLGGGLEVACAGSQIFVHADAWLGQPEIKLAVFAPAASCLLPERIGQNRAEELLLSGRSISGEEAYRVGLANSVDEDPQAAALAWFDQYLAAASASSVRFAMGAVRLGLAERIKAKLEAVEALYLDGLMSTHDAEEGLNAFIEKRPATWRYN
ncbi:cyclohexa-1,5-dienecarbonyl-CoA hydratase [Gammaproteobacteria bacterium]|nr:cyclohexa-1,5-dienecarbonyl-CoA hydratase [Gammaproteobacteria bacterium]